MPGARAVEQRFHPPGELPSDRREESDQCWSGCPLCSCLSPQSFFAPTPMGLGAGRPGTGTALGSSFPEGRMWDLRSAYTGYFVQCVLRLALSLARSAPTPGAALCRRSTSLLPLSSHPTKNDFVFVSGHLHVKGKEEKMSKSLKNYITIKVLWSSCSCAAASMPGPSGRPRDPSPITSVLWPHSLLPLLGSGGSSFCTSRDSPTPSPLPVAPALLSVPAFLGDLHLSLCFSFHEVFALGPHLLGPPFSTLPHSPPAQQACAAVGSAFAGMLTCLINFRAVG